MNDAKYIGLDVHQATIPVAVHDSAGQPVMEATLETKAETILQFLRGLRGSLHVTFEEGTWAAWLHDLRLSHLQQYNFGTASCVVPGMNDMMRRNNGGVFMSSFTGPESVVAPATTKTKNFTTKVILFTAIVVVAVAFVGRYVFRYYLHYNEAAFTDPTRGAANYWIMRGWLLTHMTGGMVALLTGPWQFWTGFRRRFASVHRWTGRIFLCGVALGSIGALRLIVGTTFGWGFGFSLFGLVLAWLTTSGMAYYAITRGNVAVHKEWMVRAYVVTFAFVTFRLFNDYGPTSRLQPDNDRSITIGWACWALPLLVTEVVLQLKRMRTLSRTT